MADDPAEGYASTVQRFERQHHENGTMYGDTWAFQSVRLVRPLAPDLALRHLSPGPDPGRDVLLQQPYEFEPEVCRAVRRPVLGRELDVPRRHLDLQWYLAQRHAEPPARLHQLSPRLELRLHGLGRDGRVRAPLWWVHAERLQARIADEYLVGQTWGFEGINAGAARPSGSISPVAPYAPLPPPPPLYADGLAFDSAESSVVLFGGYV